MFDGFQDRCNKPDSANHPKGKFWRTEGVHLSHELNAFIFGANLLPPVSQARIPLEQIRVYKITAILLNEIVNASAGGKHNYSLLFGK